MAIDSERTLPESHSTGQIMLERAQANGIKLVATDYDGTIMGDAITHQQATSLILAIARQTPENSGAIPLIATARDATIQKAQFQALLEATAQEGQQFNPIFVATANGASMYVIHRGQLGLIYENRLTQEDLSHIASAYQELGIQISDQRDERRQTDLAQNWEGIIPEETLDFARRHRGLWAEQTKVTLLLEEGQNDHSSVATALREHLGPEFSVGWTTAPILDITKTLPEDGKMYAVHKLSEFLGIDSSNLATFGDMPDGNDRHLLSAVEFGFTSREDYPTRSDQAPFVLPHTSDSAVQRTHDAIRFVVGIA
ncbi:MAG TPA: HAD family hydrolase [Patescibacteria group bacterium]|nr:HAD family hydrolase [Patescibacteria group bacterium]